MVTLLFSDIKIQSIVNLIILTCVIILNFLIAWVLGPAEFGKYAGFQAISLIVRPLATLRIETRIAKCNSERELQSIFVACLTSAIIFVFICSIILLIPIWRLDWFLMLGVVLLAATSGIIETIIAIHSYHGHTHQILKSRLIKQLLPISLACVSATIFGSSSAVSLILTAGFIISFVILIFH